MKFFTSPEDTENKKICENIYNINQLNKSVSFAKKRGVNFSTDQLISFYKEYLPGLEGRIAVEETKEKIKEKFKNKEKFKDDIKLSEEYKDFIGIFINSDYTNYMVSNSKVCKDYLEKNKLSSVADLFKNKDGTKKFSKVKSPLQHAKSESKLNSPSLLRKLNLELPRLPSIRHTSFNFSLSKKSSSKKSLSKLSKKTSSKSSKKSLSKLSKKTSSKSSKKTSSKKSTKSV